MQLVMFPVHVTKHAICYPTFNILLHVADLIHTTNVTIHVVHDLASATYHLHNRRTLVSHKVYVA